MNNPKYKLDNIDLHILRIIQKDSKKSYKEIAEALELSRTPVFERIKKMERNGIIKQYVAIIDEKRVKPTELIFCHVKIKKNEPESIKKFESLIQSIPQIVECHHVTGECDCILKIRVKNMKEYQNLVLSQLSTQNNIVSSHSYFSLDEVKHQIHVDI